MLIDSEVLKQRLKEVDLIYESFNHVGIPSYPIFKGLIEGLEQESTEGKL